MSYHIPTEEELQFNYGNPVWDLLRICRGQEEKIDQLERDLNELKDHTHQHSCPCQPLE